MKYTKEDYIYFIAKRHSKGGVDYTYILNRDYSIEEYNPKEGITLDNLFYRECANRVLKKLKDMKFKIREYEGCDWRGDTLYDVGEVSLDFEYRLAEVKISYFEEEED